MKKIFGLAVLPFFIVFNIYSQLSTPLFRHYSPENGLPSSQVYQVIQDKEGYLWFATDHGVTRYNGYEFKTYTTASGLTDNTILKIFLDHKNRIWMQTFSGQLFYFDKDKIVAYQYNSIISDVIRSNIPLGFFVDSLENVYFASSVLGEFQIGNNGKVQIIFKYVSNNNYNQVFLDLAEGNPCLISGSTLADIKKPCYIYYQNDKQGVDSILIPQQVSGPVFAWRLNNKHVFVSVSKSIFEFSENKFEAQFELPAFINSIYQDKNNSVWISTYQGLFLLKDHDKPFLFTRYLNNDFISGVIEDHEGGFWITTVNNGVFYLPDDKIKSFVFSGDSLKEPLCLATGRNVLFAGFWNGRLAELNTSSCKTIYSTHAVSHITSLFYDDFKNRLYVAKDSSGYLENKSFISFKGKITRALKGNFIRRRNGDIYNASIYGIYAIINDNISIVTALNQRVNCMIENARGEILIGCNNGAFKLDEQTKSCTLINDKFRNIRVDDIKYFKSDLCFATRGQGLFLMHNGQVKIIDETDGLCSNILHKLAVSKDAIWCASYNGISKITFKDNFDYVITNISINDGLPNNEINDLAVLNDTIWVASKSAISFLNSATDFSNATPPLIHFTAFRINNKDTKMVNNSKFSYHANNISIGFEALSFKSAGKINYKYLLINETDSLESTTNNRKVEFLSLKPGNYTFSVNAMNRSGIWNAKPIQLQFTVLQPFWQRWWFQILVIFLAGIAIYFLVKQRIARVRKEEKIKADFNKQIVLLEMKALRSQMNPHFVFNVMNSIQDYILKNDAKSAQRYLTKFARLVRLILDNSVEGEVVLKDELKAAVLYVELERQRFDDSFEFVLDVDNQLEVEELLIPSMIIQPYLENAIKHGVSHLEKNGKLTLVVTEKNGMVFINITDNGVGRAAAGVWNKMSVREHISHGSTITANRIAAYNIAHNTHIQTNITDLKSEAGLASGTRVVVVIPVKYKNSLIPKS